MEAGYDFYFKSFSKGYLHAKGITIKEICTYMCHINNATFF